jgi:hypothetical protein
LCQLRHSVMNSLCCQSVSSSLLPSPLAMLMGRLLRICAHKQWQTDCLGSCQTYGWFTSGSRHIHGDICARIYV